MAQEQMTKYAWRLTSSEYRKDYKQEEPCTMDMKQ